MNDSHDMPADGSDREQSMDAGHDAPIAVGPPPSAFIDSCRDGGLEFESDELGRLEAYLDHLLEVNRYFNLTRITDSESAWMRHVFDSLTLLPYLLQSQAERVLDVGSGGGLPGIPLAITAPHVAVTLLESTGKKAQFLVDAAETLGLDNVSVVCERAEVLGHDRDDHREMYDIVTARAVGRLPVLLEFALPFVRRGGHFLAIKGEQAEDEIDEARGALATLMGRVADTVRTPTGTIVVIEKTGKTPRIYPRRTGEPKRVPLH